MSNPGYLVWNPAARLPSYIHDTFQAAQAEAKRLANQHRGQRFFVMQSAGFAHFPVPEAEWHDADGVPF